MKLEVGQELVRQTKTGVDTCTVLRFDQIPRLDGSVLVTAVLSNGERVDPEGWYFDPANPSAWRAVEKPEPVKVRTIDEILDDIERYFDESGAGQMLSRDHGHNTAFFALRAELKALVESLIAEAREAEAERISNSQDWRGEDE